MRLLWLCVPLPALAHTSGVPHEEPGWTLTPSIVVPIALAVFLYASGAARLWRRSRLGRVELRRRCGWFALGWLTLAVAAISPLHEAGEQSFALHMLEHELLMLVAAPFLVLAAPLEIMLWSFGMGARRVLGALIRRRVVTISWRWLHGLALTTVLQAAMLWCWHAPVLFQRALQHEGWHIVQHLSFLFAALLFWSAMLRERDGRAALAALCLFFTSLVGGALGALMTFAHSPWYQAYVAMGLTPYGLTPQEDQQLAGLLMWIPGGVVHAGAALAMLMRTLRTESAHQHSSTVLY